MQRTFNYTGRHKIDQRDALFSFDGPEDAPSFNVEFRINENEFPKDASLYVEAYYKETRQRYDFGKISKITPPIDRSLSEIDLSGPTQFRVLIVDESELNGLLLGSGSSFRADADDENNNRASILTVRKKPLGQLAWKVEFETGGVPELCINTNIPNAIDKMRSDPYFQSLILPAALKEVLIYFLWNEIDEESEISKRWMEFATHFGDEKPDTEDPLALIQWIDDVVFEFSRKFELCDRLLEVVKEL